MHTGHQAARRRSHRASPVPIAQKKLGAWAILSSSRNGRKLLIRPKLISENRTLTTDPFIAVIIGPPKRYGLRNQLAGEG